MQRIRKLVLPVAGMGKRLRPLTNRCPKALVSLSGVPMLDYFIQEGIASGISEFILIINPRHARHFSEYIRTRRKKFPGATFHVRIQETPGGNGHAIIQAADLIKNEPFAVRFCDDLIFESKPVVQSLIDIYGIYRRPVMLLERIPKSKVSRYGVVKATPAAKGLVEGGKLFRITDIVEKPKRSEAPSNLIIVGGYILTPTIIRNLTRIVNSLPIVAADALPLAIGLQMELIIGEKVFGWEFPGKRMDCGTLDGLEKTQNFLHSRPSNISAG